MSQKYVIAHFFDSQPAGFNFDRAEWPLHVTLLPNFTIQEPLHVLIEKLAKLALDTAPFTLEIAEQDMFGPEKDIPVKLVTLSSEIILLHKKLLGLSSGSFVYDTPQYVDNGFKAHVSILNGVALQTGQVKRVGNISLVDMYPDSNIARRQIIQTFPLSSPA